MADSEATGSEQLLDLTIDGPAAGGSCVARHEGRVVFVRHALPGERVRALVTADSGSYLRADAVEVLTASPDRVVEPCPHARPGRCGGCDWQHATAPAQRAIKAAVIREQFARLAGLDLGELLREVEELPGGLLGWRTRVTYAVDRDGTLGLHRARSHQVEPLDRCPLGVPGVGDHEVLAERRPGVTGIEVARDDDGVVTVLEHRPGPGRHPRGRRPPDRVRVVDGPHRLVHRLGARSFETDAAGFWQVHPAALPSLAAALSAAVAPRPGETVLELYAGAGPLTAVLAETVGADGRVVGVESSRQAVSDAEHNLADLPWAEVRHGRVSGDFVADLAAELSGEGSGVELAVLDPPRAGAGAAVVTALLAAAPRAIGYVSCDPATLARDVRVAVDAGWRLAQLRAFDAFPMTAHVECLAVLVPGAPAAG